MKQKFVVEFDHAPDRGLMSRIDLWDTIWKGSSLILNNPITWISVTEIPVEQTCGTPDNTNKTIDLLNEAAETIARLSDKLSDVKAYALGLDIEKHLRENT